MAGIDSKVNSIPSGQEHVVLRGTVIFRQSDVGSKSEHLRPFLYCNKDSVIPLFLKGDNPFENNVLHEHDGEYVEITGEIRNNVFEISNIKKVL